MTPALFSCSGPQAALSDYVSDLSYSDGYKILQLTDIHWTYETDIAFQSAYLTSIVDYAKPDFIMATGDQFLGANEATVNTLYSLFDSWKIPWSLTWGNHDRQGLYPVDFPEQRLLSGDYEHCYYKSPSDDVYGRSNYVIDLKNGSGDLKWQIYALDSNSYHYSGSGVYGYDVIHSDQIAWYEQEADAAKIGGAYVPSVAYFHIPLWQLEYAVTDKGGLRSRQWGELAEPKTSDVEGLGTDMQTWPGYVDSGFFAAAKTHGTKAMFFGHDHDDDYAAVYDGLMIGYGIKSGTSLYYGVTSAGYDMIGGSLMTLHDDGSYLCTRYYVAADEAHTLVKVDLD